MALKKKNTENSELQQQPEASVENQPESNPVDTNVDVENAAVIPDAQCGGEDKVRRRFAEVLDKYANSFMSNLSVVVSKSNGLRNCEPLSIVSAAVIAASMNLSIDPNLGYAAIVPYKKKNPTGTHSHTAQLQLMWKAYVQLAERTGQYAKLIVTEVYKDEFVSYNPFTEELSLTDKSQWKMRYEPEGKGEIVGYYAYFKLTAGFEKNMYMSAMEIERHAKKYSKSYRLGEGNWVTDFKDMGKKTVLKLLLGKYGMLSIDQQSAINIAKAIKYDQASFSGIEEDAEFEYLDNDKGNVNSEANNDRISKTLSLIKPQGENDF